MLCKHGDMDAIDIAVVGSVNLDLVVSVDRVPLVGETVLGGDLAEIGGGKGANQAVGAARLGRKVAMVGRIGDDAAGQRLRLGLEADGIDTSALLTTAGVPSGVALIAVQADGDNSIVVSPGANSHLSVFDIEAASVVASAPVVLMQAEVPLAAVEAAASRAAGTVIWNPAPAPNIESAQRLLEMIDIVVPNQTELALLAGHTGLVDSTNAPELARALPSPAVVVTLGAEGALVVTEADAVHVPAPSVAPVDTTAAGDSFCAALADQLVGGADLVAAAAWAVRVGAATTLRAGAQPSLPRRSEVDELLA